MAFLLERFILFIPSFLRNSFGIPLQIVVVSIYNPNSAKGSPFLQTLSSIYYLYIFLMMAISDWCDVISHCSFDLHVSNNEWCWASFHLFISHLYVIFGEMSV